MNDAVCFSHSWSLPKTECPDCLWDDAASPRLNLTAAQQAATQSALLSGLKTACTALTQGQRQHVEWTLSRHNLWEAIRVACNYYPGGRAR